jgi:pSer/pThr/pTyr-binding forkhead associated (FHA) protein
LIRRLLAQLQAGLTVQDTNSGHGTKVNGAAIVPGVVWDLKDGDRVDLGASGFHLTVAKW